ncbi:Alpha-1,2-mannosidase [Fulvivirga imtechensis AK7]|uniref:Alpha-1,2-mannosidase n=1 Tax=Fulvivirga imtechensis AK7 TaxID=1237149 RepID=L8JY67_9BACT|nr:GH92 family glycosyl hydrolase [Fulvivirga imtechensis]ELR72152.1 Alpha-1,2-mannosidase [Fulvivirga imtechensis AK7]
MLNLYRPQLKIACLPALALLAACSQPVEQTTVEAEVRYTDYVDPFIGTAAHGHTYPGATVPFGMVQLSPDNGTEGWDWVSGYNYDDSVIVGFSHTHLSGTGIGDLADILFMPVHRPVEAGRKVHPKNNYDFKSKFSHRNEYAEPGYYSVYLDDNHVKAELTASERAGFHQYTYDGSGAPVVVVDLGFAINWDKPTDTYLKMEEESLLVGYRKSKGWAEDQHLYFAASFSEPVAAIEIYSDTTAVTGDEADGEKLTALLRFDESVKTLKIKVGLSSADIEGAQKSLAEIPHWDFDQVRQAASDQWEKELSKIKITDPNETNKKIFYTALYHSNLAPVIYSDHNQRYKGADGKVHQAEDYTKYSIFSLWDTFRAAHPLFTITQPERVDDFINSMLSHYDEYGLLPVWELTGNETNTMTGYHAIPVITDAWLKGYDGFDREKAYEAMKKSAVQDIRGVNFYKEYGYIPADLENESVTKNLEYAFDDWCIAQVAKKLGNKEDYDYFIKRSQSYRHLYDPQTRFMRGKLTDGTWKEPFDPKFSSHRVDADYTEGNAWQHSWFVSHDVEGLIALMGGEQVFINMLDSLFNEDSDIHGDNISADISGLIGQYAHGNEPSHHIAYLYNYAGAPWKTQETVRKIMGQLYTSEPAGLCGNEDCGQMSAWYILSALGFYPVNPANGVYTIGAPLFEKAEIPLTGDTKFTVEAENVSEENIYVQSATLNDQPLSRSYITHEELMKGGNLRFVMGPEPNTSWASEEENYPYSGIKE